MKILLACLVASLAVGSNCFADAKRKLSSKGSKTICYVVNMIDYGSQAPQATLSRGATVLSVELPNAHVIDAMQLALVNGLEVCLAGKDAENITLLSKNSTLE